MVVCMKRAYFYGNFEWKKYSGKAMLYGMIMAYLLFDNTLLIICVIVPVVSWFKENLSSALSKL